MNNYSDSRIKIIRRLGKLPGLTNKFSINEKTPGQHGQFVPTNVTRTSLSDDYKQRLIEKQKVRFNYGISEKQLLSYYKKSKQKKGVTGTLLFQLLESRLDCLVYRLGFAVSIVSARQLINHRHILVNKKIIDIASFICKKNDIISVKNTEKSKNLIINCLENIEFERNDLIEECKDILNQKLNQKETPFIKLLMKTQLENLLPKHILLDSNRLQGKFLHPVNYANRILPIEDLKVIEYYSK